jgi:hypothetical protein
LFVGTVFNLFSEVPESHGLQQPHGPAQVIQCQRMQMPEQDYAVIRADTEEQSTKATKDPDVGFEQRGRSARPFA